MEETQLKCSTCREPATMQLEDETTVSVHCSSGHRSYFFKKDNGKWESQKQRQLRLNKYRLCEDCGKEYMISDHRSHHVNYEETRTRCPECAKPLLAARADKNRALQHLARENPNSPWRKWFNKAKPTIQARI